MSRRPVRRPDAAAVLAALTGRLSVAARVLAPAIEVDGGSAAPGEQAGALLDALVECARDQRDARWLLLVALHVELPTAAQVVDLGRRLELAPREHAVLELLEGALRVPQARRWDRRLTVLEGATVVDVDFCARHDLQAGIQRVVRETMPRWDAEHEITLTAWTEDPPGLRRLSARERDRVVAWDRRPTGPDAIGAAGPPEDPPSDDVVVPWRGTMVVPDVPSTRRVEQLAALAQHSGNRLAMIGYDMIPVLSADARPPQDAVDFTRWLSLVKHAHRVAAISRSAAVEFRGFTSALAAQGLPGPEVDAVPLGTEAPSPDPATALPRPGDHGAPPVLLCVGNHEPHKNQRAALHAAERLWRQGVPLEVRVVGGPGWSDDVLRPAIDELVAAGRPVTRLGAVGRTALAEEMRSADVVFFASLHEGYGLPVVEALACGTPVITASFGAQAEIAELGGCLTVDPRDDDAVEAVVRRLVTDADERARLRAETAARPTRTWEEYAADLWRVLVEEAS